MAHSKDHRSGDHLAVLRAVADTPQGAPRCLHVERATLARRVGALATVSSATSQPGKADRLSTVAGPPSHQSSQAAPRARPVTPHDVVLLELHSHHAAATPVAPSASPQSDQAAIHTQGKLRTKKRRRWK